MLCVRSAIGEVWYSPCRECTRLVTGQYLSQERQPLKLMRSISYVGGIRPFIGDFLLLSLIAGRIAIFKEQSRLFECPGSGGQHIQVMSEKSDLLSS